MISFFDWFRNSADLKKPWLVFGQGPSFSRHHELHSVIEGYNTFGLNRTCRERPMLVGHVIDIHVLREIPELESKVSYLVMPWGPHVDFRPIARKTLEDFASEIPELSRLDKQGRLLWYNLSTGGPTRPGSEVVQAHYFSGEVAVRLLAMAGAKKIRTLGMDGGTSYAKEFNASKVFEAGHNTFDLQDRPIREAVEQFGLDFGTLEVGVQ